MSHLWKSIYAIWDTVKIGLHYPIGNGNSVRFWQNKWIREMGSFISVMIQNVPEGEMTEIGSDYVNNCGMWAWDRFQKFFTPSVCLKIDEILTLHLIRRKETTIWSWENSR